MDIKDILKSNRPHLSESSIRTYKSNITKILKSVDKEFNSINDVEDNFKLIFDKLMEYPYNIRKTKMSAFIVFLDEGENNTKKRVDMLEQLRDVLFEDASKYNKKENSQELSETQKKNYIPWSEVLKTYKRLEIQAKPLFKLDELKKSQYNTIVEYVLLSCYVLIPPRRAKDYADFVIEDPDADKDNYMYSEKKGKKTFFYFIFNSYKNSSRLGTQKIPVPTKLKNIINKWKKIQKDRSKYLISTYGGKKITQVKVNQIINRIFNKNLGPSMLRHIYLTHQYKDVNLEKLQEDTKNMGNSQISRTLKYVDKTIDEEDEKKE